MAASMAGILLQAGDERVMGKETWVLLHEASFLAAGKIGEVDDTVEWVKKVQKRILAIFAGRSNLSRSQIERRWKRKDWWLSSTDCLKHGFVDKVE
jgi:ATP-dependent protease ClpP protease subunit